MTEREASREQFEVFSKEHDLDLAMIDTMSGPLYRDCNTDYAWLAWQASRKQALEERYPYDNALIKVLGVVQRYLPPDGPLTEKEALSEIIGLVDPGPWPPGPLPTPITPTGEKA